MADEMTNEDFDATDDASWQKFLEEDDAPRSEGESEDPPPAEDTQQEEAPEVETELEPVADTVVETPEVERKRAQTDNPSAETALLHELRSIREERRQLKEEIEALKNPQPKAEPETPADPLLEPERFRAQQDAQYGTLEERVAAQEQAIQQQAAMQQLTAHVGADVERARAESPNYDAARDFARQSRFNELKALHPAASDDQVLAQINQDELALAQAAIAAGERPTARLMSWASARGFTAGAQKPSPAAVPAAEAKARNQSLGGTSATKDPTPDASTFAYANQANMTDDEWMQAMARKGLV